MADDYFTIASVPAEPGADGVPAARLKLAGSFDIGSSAELRAALRAADGSHLVVDLSRVRFIDSEALSALISGYLAAERAGLTFRLTGAVGIVERVISVMGLRHLLTSPAPAPAPGRSAPR
ncbi:hypothetical protein Asi03nite_01630 [Actinoplanes siamensis]|uniref:STAS domain-containing protein n=1 Tax=Actinoplanes siamensis TaxID=1223317 RepID=A0A919N0I7_9ACTN|nr:STAS domain-containing protein [Actinoplanes siamensis]GIF02625.1 hypothetical protein Asi03nite_01630 [Actinoplanes siamensis]